jgi:hypothetical protein
LFLIQRHISSPKLLEYAEVALNEHPYEMEELIQNYCCEGDAEFCVEGPSEDRFIVHAYDSVYHGHDLGRAKLGFKLILSPLFSGKGIHFRVSEVVPRGEDDITFEIYDD